jgi:hypothetical protein
MNTEGMKLESEVGKNENSPLGGLLGLVFGVFLLFYAKDIVEAVWSVFHLPF